MDAVYSSVHFTNYNQAIYMEEWTNYAIPHDNIDTTHLFEATASIFPQFLLEDEDDGAIPMNSSVFGAKVHRNRSLMKAPVWNDLTAEALRQNQPKLRDETILASLHSTAGPVSLADFMANGYSVDMFADTSTLSHEDIWLNTTLDFLNHTFSNMKLRSNSNLYPMQSIAQTPRVRARQLSLEKFQTPITRIMR